jgi:hypothetical protein
MHVFTNAISSGDEMMQSSEGFLPFLVNFRGSFKNGSHLYTMLEPGP